MVQFQTLQGTPQGSSISDYRHSQLMDMAKQKKASEGKGFWHKTLDLLSPLTGPMFDGKKGYDFGDAASNLLNTGLTVAGILTGNPMMAGAGLGRAYGDQGGGQAAGTLGQELGNLNGKPSTTPAASPEMAGAAPSYMESALKRHDSQDSLLAQNPTNSSDAFGGSIWDMQNPKRKSLNSLLGSYA